MDERREGIDPMLHDATLTKSPPMHRHVSGLGAATVNAMGARIMRTRFVSWGILTCAAFLSTALASREAHARACSIASDCPRGFDCEPTGVLADGGPTGACTSLSCQKDSDCGPGLRCYLDMGTECVTEADGGQSCGPGSACVPQWDAPCTTDTDCGPGFTCSGSTGYYQCGPNQANVMLAPYETSTTVPCSAVPMGPPGFDASALPFQVPSICDAGSTCLSVTSKTCLAQQTPTCMTASQCPSTWTCQCPASCGGGGVEIPADAGESTVDAGCTLACVAPNSDLVPFICNGGFGLGGGGVATPPTPTTGGTDSGVTGAGASPGSGSSHGGCQVGPGDGTTGWTLGALALLAGASRRGRRRRPGRTG